MLAPDDDFKCWVLMLHDGQEYAYHHGPMTLALKWAIEEDCSLWKSYIDGKIYPFWENPWIE